MSEEENTQTQDKYKFRIGIKQTAKGEPYYDVSVKSDELEELRNNLDKAIEIAEKKIKELKGSTLASKYGM